MSARMMLDMKVEGDMMSAAVEVPGLGEFRGEGNGLLEAVRDLYNQIRHNGEARISLGDEKVEMLKKLVEEQEYHRQIREEVSELERMGIREAWAFTKSDLDDKVFVVAVPTSLNQHQHAQIADELRRLFEEMFPDDDVRPMWTVMPEDFMLGTLEPDEDDVRVYETPVSISTFKPGEPVRIGEVKDLIRRGTTVGMRVVDMLDDTNHEEEACVVLQVDKSTLYAIDEFAIFGDHLVGDERREYIFRHADEFRFSAVRVDGMGLMPDGALCYKRSEENMPLEIDDGEYETTIWHIKED